MEEAAFIEVITMSRIYITRDKSTGIYAVKGGYDRNGKRYKIVYRQSKTAANVVAEARRKIRAQKKAKGLKRR